MMSKSQQKRINAQKGLMQDYQVGELWKIIPNAGDDSAYYWIQKCEYLIRKLVEERQRFYAYADNRGMVSGLHMALKDFGIDPADFS